MGKLEFYVKSMRLRTLPLSLSGVVLGMSLAASDYKISWLVAALVALTTCCLQILSNISNELGDALSGVDTEDRNGPQYSLSAGGLTVAEMRRFIKIMALACMLSGLLMLYVSFGTLFALEPLCLTALGAAAIGGAIKYTLGPNPYGYRGLGDISVFTFFGIVSLLGSYFVVAHTIPSWIFILPAVAIGCFSVGVLNVNNMRDMKTDAGIRVTVPIRIGLRNAKIYHTVLIVAGWVCLTAFNLMRYPDPWHWLFFITLPLYVRHLAGVWKLSGRALDTMLPMLVLITFALSVLMSLGYLMFLIA